MIAINYLAILATLASPLFVGATDYTRLLPVYVCLTQEDVDKGIDFITMLNGSPAETYSTAVEGPCAEAKAAQQLGLGEVLLSSDRDAKATFQVYPIAGDGVAAGTAQRCTVVVKDWPKKEEPVFYGRDWRGVFEGVKDFKTEGMKGKEGEGLFSIECSMIEPGDKDAELPELPE